MRLTEFKFESIFILMSEIDHGIMQYHKNLREHLRADLISLTGRLHLNITIAMYSYQKLRNFKCG